MKRRTAIRNLALGTGGIMAITNQACAQTSTHEETTNAMKEEKLKGNINHSVCRWCYNDIPLEELIDASKDMGLQSIEIVGPDDWDLIVKAGLTVGMGTAPFISLTDGMNNPKNHEAVKEPYFKIIEKAADLGIKNIICFSGNRNGMADDVGMETVQLGLIRLSNMLKSME